MKPAIMVVILLGILGFMGVVVMSTLQRSEVECEVCLVFDGEEVCRLGRGPTQAEALAAAQQSVCGGNTNGMAESIACAGRQPEQATCGAAN